MDEPQPPDAGRAETEAPGPLSVHLVFRGGTLEIRGKDKGILAAEDLPQGALWDARSACFRAPAMLYADVMRALARRKAEVQDDARAYTELPSGARVHKEPRPYQTEAVDAWRAAKGRGVVVLPTGAGKTHVASLAIDEKRRSTLVVAPTLDLVRQWYAMLKATFPGPIGLMGGGDYEIAPITVTTYDSAYLHIEHVGARFGLIIFDECHHLPGASYAFAARGCIAPFRLGLTATPERADGRESDLEELIGPFVYRRDIVELSGDYLAEYEVERVELELSPEERTEYEAERAIYRGFIVRSGIRMASPAGWSEFIMLSARSEDGRRAMKAYRRHKELAFAASAKMDFVEHLLDFHKDERAILFTQDNATAYALSRRFLVPAITHQTKVKERTEILERLSSGVYGAVVTSKVLNEGVDVPEASVAVVVSGSGSVREHVQRLGRVLRKKEGKRAVLYELVTAGTSETYTSDRRRSHVAYR